MGTTWDVAIFGCTSDIGASCKACFCLCCLIADNSSRLDGNQNTCCCCYPGHAGKNRAQAKARFNFGPPTCEDWCLSCCCMCCSEIQIKRELDNRKVKGYAGTEGTDAGAAAAAPAAQAMP